MSKNILSIQEINWKTTEQATMNLAPVLFHIFFLSFLTISNGFLQLPISFTFHKKWIARKSIIRFETLNSEQNELATNSVPRKLPLVKNLFLPTTSKSELQSQRKPERSYHSISNLGKLLSNFRKEIKKGLTCTNDEGRKITMNFVNKFLEIPDLPEFECSNFFQLLQAANFRVIMEKNPEIKETLITKVFTHAPLETIGFYRLTNFLNALEYAGFSWKDLQFVIHGKSAKKLFMSNLQKIIESKKEFFNISNYELNVETENKSEDLLQDIDLDADPELSGDVDQGEAQREHTLARKLPVTVTNWEEVDNSPIKSEIKKKYMISSYTTILYRLSRFGIAWNDLPLEIQQFSLRFIQDFLPFFSPTSFAKLIKCFGNFGLKWHDLSKVMIYNHPNYSSLNNTNHHAESFGPSLAADTAGRIVEMDVTGNQKTFIERMNTIHITQNSSSSPLSKLLFQRALELVDHFTLGDFSNYIFGADDIEMPWHEDPSLCNQMFLVLQKHSKSLKFLPKLNETIPTDPSSISSNMAATKPQHHLLFSRAFASFIFYLGKKDYDWRNVNANRRKIIFDCLEQCYSSIQVQELSLMLYGFARMNMRWERDFSLKARSSINAVFKRLSDYPIDKIQLGQATFILYGVGKLSAFYHTLPLTMRLFVDKLISNIKVLENQPFFYINNIFFGLAAMEMKWYDLPETIQFNLWKSLENKLNRHSAISEVSGIMFAFVLLTFDNPLYQEPYSEQNSQQKILFEIHQLLLTQLKRFQLPTTSSINEVVKHPLIKFKPSLEQSNICTHIYDYYEFLKMLHPQWIEQLFPSTNKTQVAASAKELVPTFPLIKSSLRKMYLSRNEMEFAEELKLQLKKLDSMIPFILESCVTPAVPNYFPVDYMISERIPTDSNNGQEEKKEIRAFIEIYTRPPYDEFVPKKEEEYFRRHELLKTHFYSHHFPDIPFFRIRGKDVEEHSNQVQMAKMLIEQIVPAEILARLPTTANDNEQYSQHQQPPPPSQQQQELQEQTGEQKEEEKKEQ